MHAVVLGHIFTMFEGNLTLKDFNMEPAASVLLPDNSSPVQDFYNCCDPKQDSKFRRIYVGSAAVPGGLSLSV